MRHLSVLPLLCVLLGSAQAAPAPAVSKGGVTATSKPFADDRPGATSWGTTFTVPKGWSLKSAAALAILTPPEPDARIAIVDVVQAADANAAVDAAWRVYRPDVHRAVRLSAPGAARDGWDQRQDFVYETSPNERTYVAAIALRAGTAWTVGIVDAGEATIEKRAAAALLISQSIRPAGYRRESFAGRAPHELDAARVEMLRAFVQTSMQQIGIPGAAMALIDHDRIVFEGGFGVKTLGKPDPVDADTLFMIASNTKSMSTLLLAKLVDQGKLSWEEPVTQAYPAFRLGSDETTKKVLVRHLVCACTGLPRKDMEWLLNTSPTTPAAATFAQLAGTEPTSGFGEVFQYNNNMAAAAGYIGGHLAYPKLELGAAYDRAMQTMIFTPLGMTHTTFDLAKAQAGDFASPHGDDVDGQTRLAGMGYNYAAFPYRPAAGAWSSAHDMIRYVRDELDLGRLPDGKQLVSAANLLARRAPNVPTDEGGFYGMGLEGDTRTGVTVIHHGGSMAGYKSDILFIPDADIGAVILTNDEEGTLLLKPFMRRLLEIVYDGKPEAAGDVAAAAAHNQSDIAATRRRLAVPADPSAAAALAARYDNPDLGHIAVSHDRTGVSFDFGSWKSHVASRKNDDGSISFITIDPAVFGFEFVVAQHAGRGELILRDSQHEYIYNAID